MLQKCNLPTTGVKMLYLVPQVVALIIYKGLHHVVRILLGTPVGGLNFMSPVFVSLGNGFHQTKVKQNHQNQQKNEHLNRSHAGF